MIFNSLFGGILRYNKIQKWLNVSFRQEFQALKPPLTLPPPLLIPQRIIILTMFFILTAIDNFLLFYQLIKFDTSLKNLASHAVDYPNVYVIRNLR